MSEAEEYLEWKRGFSWEDDGLAAFLALKTLEKVRFELTMRETGYVDRIRELTE